jgi:hypothetical protein
MNGTADRLFPDCASGISVRNVEISQADCTRAFSDGFDTPSILDAEDLTARQAGQCAVASTLSSSSISDVSLSSPIYS